MFVHTAPKSGDSLSIPFRHENCAEISVSYVNKRPIRYGFRGGARAILYSVGIALYFVEFHAEMMPESSVPEGSESYNP